MSKGKRRAKPKQTCFRGKATITGRITSTRRNKPVAGAEVILTIDVYSRAKNGGQLAHEEAGATTDEKGRYTITMPGLKDYDLDMQSVHPWISVKAHGFAPKRDFAFSRKSELPFTGKRVKADLQLKPAYDLAGRVIDEKGRPIEGLEVIVYQCSSHGCFNPSLTNGWPITDAEGRFLAEGMPTVIPSDDRQVAGFFHQDFERRFIERIGDLPRERNGVADVGDVVLRKGLRLSGVVRDAKGKSVSDANVFVMAARPYEGDPGCARPPAKWGLKTGADGRYVANGLPPMFYHVIVTHPSKPPGARMDVKLMTRSRSDVEVVLDKAMGVLEGTVTNADGSPAVNLKLRAEQYYTSTRKAATTNKRGEYRLAGFAPDLSVTFEGFTDMDDLAWFDPPNEKADIRLPVELTVTGRLVDARSGRPISGKKSLLLSTYPSFGQGFSAESATRSGRFEIPGVWAGSYYLIVRARGYATTCRPVRVKKEHVDLGDVPVNRGVKLKGAVTTSTGRPIRNAEVFVDSPQYYGGTGVRTNAKGRYAFGTLEDGGYQFRVRAEGWAPVYEQEMVLPVEGGTVVKDVRMVKGQPLRGRVLSGGVPVERQVVILSARKPRGRRQKRPWIADVNTDESGEFVFPNVAPGAYAIRCGLVERNITVTRGKTAVCNFRWPGPFKLEPDKKKGGHAV